MRTGIETTQFVPQFDPRIMNGKLTYKIIIKSDHIRKDNTCALYLQLYLNGKRKRIPLKLYVPLNHFDKNKQRVNKKSPNFKDYNLIIEKHLADLNEIEINYRFNNQVLTIEKIIEELQNPNLRVDFISFALKMLEDQKGSLELSTYKQQKGVINKISRFKSPLYFYEINEQLLKDLRFWMKSKLKNAPATVESTLKSFKKYLHLANKRGINTEIKYDNIKVRKMTGDRLFLMPNELVLLVKYYESEFIKESHKNILGRYLFSCFTGLRISDIERLTEENFNDDQLTFTAAKTKKFQRIKLNQTAHKFYQLPQVFNENYTREYINRELKKIATHLGIKKRIYFHSSRHTFATIYLMQGGRVEVLQKLLGHSEIKETMIYVHIAESIKDEQIMSMDQIFN
ncbi:site-specific integrase [Aquimarina litoralis]|uniref:site-specific integrase n=1 Tax=Aquimarina litoralis TaxID=584605 RepID=UPI001C59AC2D|nr:site-specific integrase [Aquimarina litoralis]MBW1297833.1 tyrosine-type recombinase/integrase [Aquimarina litoralis]